MGDGAQNETASVGWQRQVVSTHHRPPRVGVGAKGVLDSCLSDHAASRLSPHGRLIPWLKVSRAARVSFDASRGGMKTRVGQPDSASLFESDEERRTMSSEEHSVQGFFQGCQASIL